MITKHDMAAVAEWLVGDDTGLSSKYMLATALSGVVPKYKWGVEYPLDGSDLGRCIRLIQSAPSVRNALPILAAASPKWAALAADWDALVADWDFLVVIHDDTPGVQDFRYRVITSRMNVLFSSTNETNTDAAPKSVAS